MINVSAQDPDGGCEVAEDPMNDARTAHPLWADDTDKLLHVRRAPARGMDDHRFSVWRITGRKRIAHTGSALLVVATHGPHWLRASLADTVEEGAHFGLTIPLDKQLRTHLSLFREQAREVQGLCPPPAFSAASRAGLIHLRALQAIDALHAGASQREMAEVIFGIEAVRERWSADGELRAQMRHLLSRGKRWMRGGYVALAGVPAVRAEPEGDKPGP
jgi:hypothetical protein